MFQGGCGVAVVSNWACFSIYLRCQPPKALDCLIRAVRSDKFGAIIAGKIMSAIVAGIVKLTVAQFSHWRHFFTAFLEVVVSMVTKKGEFHSQWLQTEMMEDGGRGVL